MVTTSPHTTSPPKKGAKAGKRGPDPATGLPTIKSIIPSKLAGKTATEMEASLAVHWNIDPGSIKCYLDVWEFCFHDYVPDWERLKDAIAHLGRVSISYSYREGCIVRLQLNSLTVKHLAMRVTESETNGCD